MSMTSLSRCYDNRNDCDLADRLTTRTVSMNECSSFSRSEYFSYPMNKVCVITVDPVYSKLGYNEYPVIVNGFLRTDP